MEPKSVPLEAQELKNAAEMAYDQLLSLLQAPPTLTRPNEAIGNAIPLNNRQDATNFGPTAALFTMMSIISNYLPPVTPEPEKLAEKPSEASPWVQGIINAIGAVQKIDAFSFTTDPVSSPVQSLQPLATPLAPVAPLSLADLPSSSKIQPYHQQMAATEPVSLPLSALSPIEHSSTIQLQKLPTPLDARLDPLKENPVVVAPQTESLSYQTIQREEPIPPPQQIVLPTPISTPRSTNAIGEGANELFELTPLAVEENFATIVQPALFATVTTSTRPSLDKAMLTIATPTPTNQPPVEPISETPLFADVKIDFGVSEVFQPSLTETTLIAPLTDQTQEELAPVRTTPYSHPAQLTPQIAAHVVTPSFSAMTPQSPRIENAHDAVAHVVSKTVVNTATTEKPRISPTSLQDQARMDSALLLEEMMTDNLISLAIQRQQKMQLEKQMQKSGTNSLVGGIPNPPPMPIVKKAALSKNEVYVTIAVNGKTVQFDVGNRSDLSDPAKQLAMAQTLLEQLKSEYDADGLWSEDEMANLLAEIQRYIQQLPLPHAKHHPLASRPDIAAPISLNI